MFSATRPAWCLACMPPCLGGASSVCLCCLPLPLSIYVCLPLSASVYLCLSACVCVCLSSHPAQLELREQLSSLAARLRVAETRSKEQEDRADKVRGMRSVCGVTEIG